MSFSMGAADSGELGRSRVSFRLHPVQSTASRSYLPPENRRKSAPRRATPGGPHSPKNEGRWETASRKDWVSTDLSGGSGLNWLSSRRVMARLWELRRSDRHRRQQAARAAEQNPNPELCSERGRSLSDRWGITHKGARGDAHTASSALRY